MQVPTPLPAIAFVRVRSAGGPYRVDDVLSMAFTTPGVGRLVAHDMERCAPPPQADGPIVPEAIAVDVTVGAEPYAAGDRLMLSFIDPSVARIHSIGKYEQNQPATLPSSPRVKSDTRAPEDELMLAAVEAIETNDEPLEPYPDGEIAVDWAYIERAVEPESRRNVPAASRNSESDVHATTLPGVRVKLGWDAERTRRFVQVVDKLFAVDRLGWYRHVLAVRLLVPDEIATGDGPADVDAGQQLRALRSAAAQALGRPLLAACMPNFSVTPEWLDELDSVGAARAIAGLRNAILPHVSDDGAIAATDPGERCTVGVVTRQELLATPPANVEALLPVLMPCGSHVPKLTEKLLDYRFALVEVFRQTANSAEAVRLNAMSQTNHALDDRLWQVVGTIGESFGGLSVA